MKPRPPRRREEGVAIAREPIGATRFTARTELLNQRVAEGGPLTQQEQEFQDNDNDALTRGQGTVDDAIISQGLLAEQALLNMQQGNAAEPLDAGSDRDGRRAHRGHLRHDPGAGRRPCRAEAVDPGQATIAALSTQLTSTSLTATAAAVAVGQTATVAAVPPSPTPTATQTPPPQAGAVLYEADTSGGLGRFDAGPGWNTVDGMLVSDGSAKATVDAPFDPGDLANYAVEVEMQWIGGPYGKNFGINTRERAGGDRRGLRPQQPMVRDSGQGQARCDAEPEVGRGLAHGPARGRREPDSPADRRGIVLAVQDNQDLAPGLAGLVA